MFKLNVTAVTYGGILTFAMNFTEADRPPSPERVLQVRAAPPKPRRLETGCSLSRLFSSGLSPGTGLQLAVAFDHPHRILASRGNFGTMAEKRVDDRRDAPRNMLAEAQHILQDRLIQLGLKRSSGSPLRSVIRSIAALSPSFLKWSCFSARPCQKVRFRWTKAVPDPPHVI
jgi:hypothetical protein